MKRFLETALYAVIIAIMVGIGVAGEFIIAEAFNYTVGGLPYAEFTKAYFDSHPNIFIAEIVVTALLIVVGSIYMYGEVNKKIEE